MNDTTRRAVAASCAAICAAIGLAPGSGCARYEPAPLDLAAHASEVEGRLRSVEAVAAFAERLRASRAGELDVAEAPARFDPADGLSAAEGEVLALFYRPELRLARSEAAVARAIRDTSGLWEDPEFGFDGAEILSASAPFEYGLTLGLTLPLSGRLPVERDRADASHDVALLRIVEAEWRTRFDVRRVWSRWSAAAARVELMDELLEQIAATRRITDDLAEGGELSRVDARLVAIEQASRRADRRRARADEERARIELLALMGLPAGSEVVLEPSLAAGTATGPDSTFERSPALAVRRAEHRVAEETLRLEVRRQYPDVRIGGGYGSEGDDRLLLGVSLPIPIFNANRAAIAEAAARRDLTRAAAEAEVERLARDMAIAIADRDAARSEVEHVEREIVPMLVEQVRDIERLAELGEVDTLVMLDALTRRFDAKARLLDLQVAHALSAARIREIAGPDHPLPPAPVRPSSADVAPGGGDAP